jgi:hypothetical protein
MSPTLRYQQRQQTLDHKNQRQRLPERAAVQGTDRSASRRIGLRLAGARAPHGAEKFR